MNSARDNGLEVSEGMRHYPNCKTSWTITVMDAVLEDAIISERNFKEYFRTLLEKLVQQAADEFFVTHQEWIRDVFNVQSLRIALLEELQRRVAQAVPPDVSDVPELRSQCSEHPTASEGIVPGNRRD